MTTYATALITALLFLGGAIMWSKIAQISIVHTCYNLGSFSQLCDLAVPFTSGLLKSCSKGYLLLGSFLILQNATVGEKKLDFVVLNLNSFLGISFTRRKYYKKYCILPYYITLY